MGAPPLAGSSSLPPSLRGGRIRRRRLPGRRDTVTSGPAGSRRRPLPAPLRPAPPQPPAPPPSVGPGPARLRGWFMVRLQGPRAGPGRERSDGGWEDGYVSTNKCVVRRDSPGLSGNWLKDLHRRVGNGLPRAVVTALGCWSSRSVWTMLSYVGFGFWVVLCGGRIRRSSRVPSISGYPVIL